ncbi:hypothetical protein LJR044_003162 [Microbacterium foliorum]
MAEDLNRKFEKQLEKLSKDVARLQRTNPLESASVTSGRVRFIGGLLRVDSGGRVEIDGTFVGAGGMTWTGTVTLESTFTQNGPWFLNGPGTISGNVTQTGNTNQQGNVALAGGGKLTAGNVTVEPNKVTVGTAPNAAVLQNGELALSNGAKVAVGLTGGSSSIGLLPGGSADISVNTLTAWLRATGSTISVTTAQASISAPNIFMANLPTGAPAGAKAVLVDPSNGKLYRAA